MIAQKILELDHSFIHMLLQNKGPEPFQYQELKNWFDRIERKRASGKLSSEDTKQLHTLFGEVYLSANSLLGHAFIQPYGYPGDFELTDKIYSHHITTRPNSEKWDRYFQNSATARAIRHHKALFKNLLYQKSVQGRGSIKVLNIAGSPGRSLKEFFAVHPKAGIRIDCLETDANAIEYAQQLLGEHFEKVRFIHQSIAHFQAQKTYDLIWSADLFNYFDDQIFAKILSKLLRCVNPGGAIVIGNFDPVNPTKSTMDFSRWHLHHRSISRLRQLAQGCNIPPRCIQLIQEAEGVNSFLSIHNHFQTSKK